MDEHERTEPADTEDGPVELDEPVETMSLANSFGTALGSAMLGFEQALRNDPPAEVQAAEHMPERGTIGEDDGLLLEFPEPIRRRVDE
jgi:hypothetical protein